MSAEPASDAEIDCMAFTIRRWAEFRGVPLLAVLAKLNEPIPMVLYCPECGVQHVDAPNSEPSAHPDGRETMWTNPPHRSHLCGSCGYIWRPADVPTEGVESIATMGMLDSPRVIRAALADQGDKS